VIKTDLLDVLAQFRIRLPGQVLIKVPVETCAANTRGIACFQNRESGFAFQLHHFSVQRASPGALFFERASFTRLKALLKKSFSSAILPSRRSNSTILSSAVVDGLAVAFLFAPGRGPLGWPKPAFPFSRYESRQR
jgi:hypothetical protein